MESTPVFKSAKRLAREAKLAKQQANMRSLEERTREIMVIKDKFRELAIPDDFLTDFNSIMDQYINSGGSYNGSIKIEAIGRKIVYSLTMDKRIPVSVVLRVLE